MADNPHPKVTGSLDSARRCIVITVAGGSRTATFKTTDVPEALWSDTSPCPPWAQDAVRGWSRTPGAVALFRQLARLQGKPSQQDDIETAADRPPKR